MGLWWTRVPRPFDAPVVNASQTKAHDTGKKLRDELAFPTYRVVSSPFRRCIKTARELIAGLSTVDNNTANTVAGDDGDSADSPTSRIKVPLPFNVLLVSIEYGMGEILNDVTLCYHPTFRDSWGFDIKELETSFPSGSRTSHRTRCTKRYELPRCGASESKARDRYLHTIHYLVDEYPQENLLFVTHGEGVKVTALTYWKEARGQEIKPGRRARAATTTRVNWCLHLSSIGSA
ncbi:hypothetical protein ACJRO7_020336 [Eucalyptus globulus]|uniref:Uncharacterized protein n=1 Tax=Eucalyptus globulus TaxID=34317 RepID=A0ABD3KG76_EUCGL